MSENLIEQLKKDNINNQLFEKVNRNPNLLKSLSVEELINLNNIYIEKIKQQNIEIQNLEKQISKLKSNNKKCE